MSNSETFTCDYTLTTIYITICLLLSISMIFILCFFISKWREETYRTKIVVVMFFVCSIISIVLLIPIVCWRCIKISYQIHEIAENVFIGFYALQSYLVVVIFYHKLNIVFNNTTFELSQCTKIMYYSTFIIFPLIVLIIFILYIDNHSLIETFIGFGLVLLMSSLGFLFIAKLIIVFRFNQQNTARHRNENDTKNSTDNTIEIDAMTKITILTLTSIFSTFIHVIAALTINDIFELKSIYYYCELLDVYSHFVCIILCYHCFRGGYTKICAYIDAFCHVCCTKLANYSTNNTSKLAKYIINNSSNQKPEIKIHHVTKVEQGTNDNNKTVDV